MSDALITVKAGERELALISALIQQPRRIEHSFRNRSFIVDHDWCRNLVAICEQRMGQHKYKIFSFSCEIYYDNGRVDKISTKDSFDAYIDKQSCLSVGVDMTMSFLVYFGDNIEPEKQDVRFYAFSDESYKYFLKPKHKWLYGPIISSSISSSNLTWAEDMEGHIGRHIDSALKTSLFSKFVSYLDDKSFPALAVAGPATILFAILVLLNFSSSHNNILQNEFNILANDNTLDAISKKINIIMQIVNRKDEMPRHFVPMTVGLIALLVFMTASMFSESLVKKFCKSFVIFNDHTKTSASKYFSKNQWLTRSLVTLLAGIPVGLLVAYIKGFFRL